jgi:hypothetical protein
MEPKKVQAQKMSQDAISKEKQHLIQIQKELEKKIQQRKEKQQPHSPTPEPEQSHSEHVETEETMSFSSNTVEAAKELDAFVPKRRVSLMEIKSSTVPDLPLTSTKKADENPQNSPAKVSDSFTMPSEARKRLLFHTLVCAST